MSLPISTNPKISASWDTINSPQAYSQRPLAASYVKDAYYLEEPKKSSWFKKTVITVIGLAVIAGGLALARTKIDALKNINLDNKAAEGLKEKTKFYVAKAGQMVIDGFNAIKAKFPKATTAAAEESENAA